MDAERLAECGRALFGAQWQSDMGRALQVNDRTVRRWLKGERPIPDRVSADVNGLLASRMAEIERLRQETGQ